MKIFLMFVKIIFFAVILLLVSCSSKNWKDYGDSCIQISDSPPLNRVINYTDHDLCDRKLSPRKAPNPRLRNKKGKRKTYMSDWD